MIIDFPLRPDPEMMDEVARWIAVAERLLDESILQIRAVPAEQVVGLFSNILLCWNFHTQSFRDVAEANDAWQASDLVETYRLEFEAKLPVRLIRQDEAFRSHVVHAMQKMADSFRDFEKELLRSLPGVQR